MLPVSRDGRVFAGHVQVEGREMWLQLHLPASSSGVRGARVELGAELSQLVSAEDVRAVLDKARSVEELCGEIAECAERSVRKSDKKTSRKRERDRGAAFFERVVGELGNAELCVVGLSDYLDSVTLQHRDEAGRVHRVSATLPPDYPARAPTCFADLPVALQIVGWNGQCSLVDVQQQFIAAIARFQPLWRQLDELDRRVWVIGSDGVASRASCSRRIVVAPHCYIQLQIDPDHPTLLPQIRFLGAERLVQPLTEALNTNCREWDSKLSLVDNLEHILSVRFEKPSDEKRGVELSSNSCGICYEFTLQNDAVPDVVCSNEKCAKAFHRICLYEWLLSVPTTKQSFATVFGQCPFCETRMVVARTK